MRREVAVLGGVEGALEVVDVGADVDPAGERAARRRSLRAGNSGRPFKREVDLRHRAHRAIVAGSSGGSPGRDRPDRPGRAASASDRRSRRRRARAPPRRSTRTTPVAAPSLVATRATAAPVRTSAPNPFAAAARACVSAPIPPRTNVAAPAALPIERGADQDAEARSGRPRAGEGAVDAARGDRRPQELRLEELGDEIGDRHRPPAQQAEGVALRQSPELAADAEQLPELAERRVVDRRAASSSGRARGACRSGRATRGTRGSPSRRAPRLFSMLRRRARGVAVERERAPVGCRREDADLRLDEGEPVTVEAEVPDDRRAETVRPRGGPTRS